MTSGSWSGRDFERIGFHDNYVYGLSIVLGDITAGDWRADLLFAIDHILEWRRGAEGRMQFLVAPAQLAFHQVTDLSLAIDWGDSGWRTALREASIHELHRTPVAVREVALERPYYRWTMALNDPHGGRITFGASDFTLTLRAAAILCDEQRLSPAQRLGADSA